MTYATEVERLGREPVTIIEMDMEFCSLTYGIAPCTASIPATGTIKCFNTSKTCQDKPNYAPATKTYRFSTIPLPVGAPKSIPNLIKVSTIPTRIDPGKGIGQRAKMTANFRDHTLSDIGLDKYLSTRPYNSSTQGTFWGKFLARNPFYQGRTVRVLTGFITGGVYDAANFQTKVYIMEQISGPDAGGNVTLTAKDILKLVDDARAQTPIASNGKLAADKSDVATTFNLLPAGIGDLEYPASGYARVGEEVVSFARTADAMLVQRAKFGTSSDAHSEGDVVQLCTQYDNVSVQDIVYDLLTVKGTVPVGYITKPDWDDEIDTWLPRHIFSTLITKPTGITKLIDELCESGLIYVWWDEIQQKILLKAIRPARDEEITEVTQSDHIIRDSVNIMDDPKDRISQVWIYYGQRDPTEDLDKVSNYNKNFVIVDTDAEDATQYGEQRIRQIFSRWLPVLNEAPAKLLGARLIARFRDNSRKITMRLDAKDSIDLWTGDIATVESRQFQDATGAPRSSAQLQVMSAQETNGGTEYTYELVDSFFQGRYGFIGPNTLGNYFLESDLNRRKYAFIAPNSGFFSDGSPAYKII